MGARELTLPPHALDYGHSDAEAIAVAFRGPASAINTVNHQPITSVSATGASLRKLMNQVIQGAVGALTVASGLAATPSHTGPLVEPWKGPHGGVPPFDRVVVSQFQPALEAAMASSRAEIQAIADNPAPPTFENTLAVLERCGRALDRVQAVYGVWSSTMSTPEFQAVEREMEPKLAAFRDEIYQNEKLFKRIEAVYGSPEKAKLTP